MGVSRHPPYSNRDTGEKRRHHLNRNSACCPPASAYAAHATAKTQRTRADGILLTQRPREPRQQTATASRAKSLELEAPIHLQTPPLPAALMVASHASR
jgi:hypothetical protein